ncbi:hypothetical protein GPX89_42755 [Nocardia sp. ET3-3]|uniref:Uncharacterized protein n=1 Tax=Nocardia terrae TaxID=2675851 RepID=A0A7K1VBI5_9NOCA|nr:hypothetical protein [Nocardia terrae]MVU83937.1 hypothetical protein [Nocardia terrae]
MAVATFPRVSPADRPTLAAGAMVLVLTALTAAFVFGAMPAVAGPAGPAPANPALVHAAVPATPHADTPATPLPSCTEITEDSVNPACTDVSADAVPGSDAAPLDQP